ncbi:MAG: glycosyltransferase [Syntrophotaleaceae bacterium]
MRRVDVLIPTCNRPASLAVTLTGVAQQSFKTLHVTIADQSEIPAMDNPAIRTLRRLILARGGSTAYFHRLPSKGIAEQRHFLLKQAQAPYVLFLDDDVLMEPWVLQQLVSILEEHRCGFVGAFGAGLSFIGDVRPEQQPIEYWQGLVKPEIVEPGSLAWERWHLHRAANLYHVGQRLPAGEMRLYKVAWIGGCVLYDRKKLQSVGGFQFWDRLPRYHSGEEALVQNLLMRRYGGCGLVPSGTFFTEEPSTVLNEEQKVDGHALDLLKDMVEGMKSGEDR